MSNPFETIVITGANRGLGLEFVQQFLRISPPPARLIATTRRPSKDQDDELHRLEAQNANLHVVHYDATDYAKLDAVVRQIEKIAKNGCVNLLINNAGIYLRNELETITAEDMLRNFEVNTVAPLMLSRALLPLMRKRPAMIGDDRDTPHNMIVNISSGLGSIGIEPIEGGKYSYRTSKAALNMLTKTMAVDLRADRITVLALRPGWVRTDMGGPKARLSPEESIRGMISVIIGADQTKTGAFLDYQGQVCPW